MQSNKDPAKPNKHQTKTTLHKLGTEENFNKIKDSYEKQTNKQKKNQS